ncbi:hypothetical protein B1748_19670 [Paenibacillus sp. MY03]|uniref:DUF3221 domain-containing protein n=1 Tax=Paenibacillus sp. MY03 TaxID=302980 RepID=UPI000B3C3C42|nr:DUF3221 domain-containing protein [Paenibacillus sp. MY03]OUS74943.1 hypothetical protein B1748_19670 [Paenibacillus sp. MY03]
MRKLVATALIMLVALLGGCSGDGGATGDKPGSGSPHDEEWEYGTGYVLEKADGRLLIVSKEFEAGATSEDVLKLGSVKAIWLKVDAGPYEDAAIGDHVRITVVGAVAESYPEQGTGSIEKIE